MNRKSDYFPATFDTLSQWRSGLVCSFGVTIVISQPWVVAMNRSKRWARTPFVVRDILLGLFGLTEKKDSIDSEHSVFFIESDYFPATFDTLSQWRYPLVALWNSGCYLKDAEEWIVSRAQDFQRFMTPKKVDGNIGE